MLIWSCLFKTASLPTVLLWCCIRSGDEGVVTELLGEMPRNDWKAQYMVCAAVGGCNAHYDSMCVCIWVYVCYRVSRWVYVIRAAHADAECWGSCKVGCERSISVQKHRIIPRLCHKSQVPFFHLSTEGQRLPLSFHKINHLMLVIHISPVQAV